jgi:hypothetical protein
VRYLALLCILVSCGQRKVDPPEPFYDDELATKASLYRTLNGDRFSEVDRCDSLLFTALAHPETVVNIWDYFDGQKWHRTPDHQCYSNYLANEEHKKDPAWVPLKPDSKSEISRDMLLGLMWYAYFHKDVKIAESIWNYGIAHKWVMGEGVGTRTVLSRPMITTLAQLIHELGGEDHYWDRVFPLVWLTSQEDYEAHLQVLHILLRTRLYDRLEETAFTRLREQGDRQPKNPLFQYAAGRNVEAANLLKNGNLWPIDHLPTSENYCSPWPVERDDGDDWLPCDEGRTHTGGDLLFTTYLLFEGH